MFGLRATPSQSRTALLAVFALFFVSASCTSSTPSGRVGSTSAGATPSATFTPVYSCIRSASAGETLSAIAAVTPTSVWAVGGERTATGEGRSLILRWDGTRWARVDAPSTSGLGDIAASSPDDVWIAGAKVSRTTEEQVFLHWAGSSWETIPSPAPKGGSLGRIATDGQNLWAIGRRLVPTGRDSQGGSPIAARWDGASWRLFDLPAPSPGHTEVHDVLARSATDVWAAGGYDTPPRDPRYEPPRLHPLLLHWDGRRWSRVDPPLPNIDGYVVALGTDGADGIWLVGSNAREGRRVKPSYFARMVGSKWKLESSPFTKGDEIPVSIDGSGPNDVWAVGSGGRGSGSVLEHWDGTHWRLVTPPLPAFHGSPEDLAVLSKSDAWAVGTRRISDELSAALIEHWDGVMWRIVAPPPSRVSPPPPSRCG